MMGISRRKQPTVVNVYSGHKVEKPKPELSDPEKAIVLVEDHILTTRADIEELEANDVYIVAFSRHLNRWTALIGTTINDNRLYQVHRGDGDLVVLQTYDQVENKALLASDVFGR